MILFRQYDERTQVMKRFLSIVLAAALCFSFAGCAENDTQAVTETEAASQAAAVANPMVETDLAGILEATGLSFEPLDGAENVKYFIYHGTLAEMQFTYDGVDYRYRMAATDKLQEVDDISGLYYQWTVEEDCEVANRIAKQRRYIGTDGYIDNILWLDVVPGVAYSLTAEAKDLDGFDILAIAEQIFTPLQGEVG